MENKLSQLSLFQSETYQQFCSESRRRKGIPYEFLSSKEVIGIRGNAKSIDEAVAGLYAHLNELYPEAI